MQQNEKSVLIMAQTTEFPSIVDLNVGGHLYTTSLSTLTRFPESMLGAMFSGRYPVLRDSRGNFFIDRNGAMFGYVLDYLRSLKLSLASNFQEHEKLRDEADFYQVPGLVEAVMSQASETKELVIVTRAFSRYYVQGKITTLQELFPTEKQEYKISAHRRRTNSVPLGLGNISRTQSGSTPWYLNLDNEVSVNYDSYLDQTVGEVGYVFIPLWLQYELQVYNLLAQHGFEVKCTCVVETKDEVSWVFSRKTKGTPISVNGAAEHEHR